MQPSGKVLHSKLMAAITSVTRGHCLEVVPDHIAADSEELVQLAPTMVNIWELIPICLSELISIDPLGTCWAAPGRPSVLSWEDNAKNLQMWHFQWDSPSLKARMYIKFCLRDDGNGCHTYLHLRLHKSKPSKSK